MPVIFLIKIQLITSFLLLTKQRIVYFDLSNKILPLAILVKRVAFSMNTLEQINNNFEYFSKSEQKVANSILESLQKRFTFVLIASLAKLANVNEPPVNRFCRRIDTKGFPDFQLRLAQSLLNGTSYVNRLVDQNDTVSCCHTQKVFDSKLVMCETRVYVVVHLNEAETFHFGKIARFIDQKHTFYD